MDLAVRYDVAETVEFIATGGYRSVALQFPDDLLCDSPKVAQLLQQELRGTARVFILADTAYNPLGVDEVAAQHLAAQCVVHYGAASLCPVSTLPAFFVLPKHELHVAATAEALAAAVAGAEAARRQRSAPAEAADGGASGDGGSGGGGGASAGYRCAVLLVDQGYQHAVPALQAALQGGQPGSQGPLPPLVFAHVPSRVLLPPAGAALSHVPQPAGGCGSGGCAGGSGAGAAGCGAAGSTGGTPAAAAAVGAAAVPGLGCCAGGAGGQGGEAAAPAAAPGQHGEGTQQGGQAATPGGCGAGACGAAGCSAAGPGGAAAAPEQSPEAPGACASRGGCSGGSEGAPAAASTSSSSSTTSMAGLAWSLPDGARPSDCLYVWVGPRGSSALQVLQLTHSTCEWRSYEPSSGAEGSGGPGGVEEGLSDETRRLLKRRNFMVEKTRHANIVGILVGTLGSRGFLDVISALRRLVAAAGKKSYTFLMGKPNPAKLGNFPEVDVFVMVADAQGLILDSRDYLAPLVTPWEAAVALGGRHLDLGGYRLDFGAVLELEAEVAAERAKAELAAAEGQGGEEEEEGEEGMALAKFGGLTLGLVGGGGGAGGSSGLSLAARGGGAVALSKHDVSARTAAEYLALKRTYKGLEMPATGASHKAAELAVEGRGGRAAVYEGEQA